VSQEFRCVRCECRFTTVPQRFYPEEAPDLYPLCWDCVDYLEAE
jgi:hypothetical protein